MVLPVELSKVAEALDFAASGCAAFIDRKTGELAWFTDEESYVDDTELADDLPDWMAEAAADLRRVTESEDFIPLPDKVEIHEYGLMEEYCLSVADDRLGGMLRDAIRGRGAFRRFKDIVTREGVRDDWFEFRHRALLAVAVEFLTANDIPFTGLEQAGGAVDGSENAAAAMFHMLSCFDLAPGVDAGAFQAEYMEFVEEMRRLGLVEGTGPLSRRQSDTPMDTDEERGHQYFLLMTFRDRAQVDAAYAHIQAHRGPGDAIHKSVYGKVRNAVFTCWQDIEPGE